MCIEFCNMAPPKGGNRLFNEVKMSKIMIFRTIRQFKSGIVRKDGELAFIRRVEGVEIK
jgi:hypothetical protein